MTREEIIEQLENAIELIKQDGKDWLDDRDIPMLEECIKALSQEPTEKPMTVDEMEREYEKSKALFHKIVECDDAISREDAINIASLHCLTIDESVKALEHLPSVTQKCEKCAMNGSGSKYCDNCGQKSGKWILTIEDWNKWTCSNCGYVKRTDIHVNIGWNYCPNCGAKMESEGRNNG